MIFQSEASSRPLSSACYLGIMTLRGALCTRGEVRAENSIERRAADTSRNTAQFRNPRIARKFTDARVISPRKSHRRINRSSGTNGTTKFLSFHPHRNRRAVDTLSRLRSSIDRMQKLRARAPDVIGVRLKLVRYVVVTVTIPAY